MKSLTRGNKKKFEKKKRKERLYNDNNFQQQFTIFGYFDNGNAIYNKILDLTH